jgi:hypothetical protein
MDQKSNANVVTTNRTPPIVYETKKQQRKGKLTGPGFVGAEEYVPAEASPAAARVDDLAAGMQPVVFPESLVPVVQHVQRGLLLGLAPPIFHPVLVGAAEHTAVVRGEDQPGNRRVHLLRASFERLCLSLHVDALDERLQSTASAEEKKRRRRRRRRRRIRRQREKTNEKAANHTAPKKVVVKYTYNKCKSITLNGGRVGRLPY